MQSRLLAAVLCLAAAACHQSSGAASPSASAGVAPTLSVAVAPEPARVAIVPVIPGVVLEQRGLGDDDEWYKVCGGGCFRLLEPDRPYRIAGNGIIDSPPFVLRSGPQLVHVEPGPTWIRTLGIVSLSVGSALALGGLLLYAGADSCGHDGCTSERNQAIASGVFGGVIAVSGLALLAASRATTVTVDRGSATALRLSPRGLEF